MTCGVFMLLIFSSRSSLKERARRASLLFGLALVPSVTAETRASATHTGAMARDMSCITGCARRADTATAVSPGAALAPIETIARRVSPRRTGAPT